MIDGPPMRISAPFFVLLVFSLVALPGCDSGGPGGEDEPPDPTDPSPSTDSVTVSAEAISESGSRIDTAAIAFDGTEVGTGYAEKTYEEDSSETVTVEADADGLVAADSSVGLGSDHNLELTLPEELPDEVTLSFSSVTADADSSAAGTWTWNGEEIASGEASGTHDVSGSDQPGELCFEEGEFFLPACRELTPNQDRSVELEVQRKEVTVSVTPEDSTGSIRSGAATKIYEPRRADSVTIEGEGAATLPKRSGTRDVFSDLITEEPDTDKLDRYLSDTSSVAADRDVSITTNLTKLPACSDGIDNDGDGFADKADVRACETLDGEYDSQDDNEILKAVKRGTSVVFDDSTFVSGKNNEQVARIRSASNPMPPSAQAAKGEVEVFIEVKQSADTSGEDYAIHIKAGPSNDNLTKSDTTEVVLDDDSRDGWYFLEAVGIQGSVFRDGPHYAVYAWDDTKALGEPPEDDGVRVYFFAEQQKIRSHSITYVYEPEDVPDSKQNTAFQQGQPTTLESGECVDRSKTDTVCRVPAGRDRF
ncbi:hypothetical protein GGP60_003073 [Salinibacter ruber]|nr:hypothetical protein [Salinibacter ruber]